MIILITGASHTGKTLLAQRLLEKIHAPYLSIDHLKMGLIRSGITHLSPQDDDALTPYLWAIVREMVKTAIENQQNLIVEGCYIPFSFRQDFDEFYLRDIRFICLAMTNHFIDRHFDEIQQHACDIEQRLETACDIEQFKKDNHQYIQGFSRMNEHIILIDKNYQQSIDKVVEKIIQAA